MAEDSTYRSPLGERYASPEMQEIWSDRRKFTTWRRLWLALAEAERDLGLPIAQDQIDELRAHLDDIDYERAAKYESEIRHDVMAHIHALGDVAPGARRIIHLGATSQFVNDNTETIQIRDSLNLFTIKLARVIDALGGFAEQHRALPTLAFTHYQPAQPTTVGKRAAMWAQEFVLALEEAEHRTRVLRFRGAKGATGTQASFLELFDGDHAKVEELDRRVTEKVGWPPDRRFTVTGQTYSRLQDALVLGSLAAAAAAVHRVCNDLRLLASRKEIEEPFESTQVGSSAMPYKRNPMRCERATALARFVMNLAPNGLQTAAEQWLERTLDDSANRRLVLPEAFLALDGCLDVMHNVCSGLVVYEATIRANLLAELPFMASENLLMAAVKTGADRQRAHEVIRRISQEAGKRVKETGSPNDLMECIKREPLFKSVDLDGMLDPSAYIGLASVQVEGFLRDIVGPVRDRYQASLAKAKNLRI
jgi:adenylosuccinate lyase